MATMLMLIISAEARHSAPKPKRDDSSRGRWRLDGGRDDFAPASVPPRTACESAVGIALLFELHSRYLPELN